MPVDGDEPNGPKRRQMRPSRLGLHVVFKVFVSRY